MKTKAKNHQAGFTLIEFIVALVIVGFLAAMLYTYFGTALTQSSVPIARLQQVSNLYRVMENIVADYNRLNQVNLRYKWRSNHSYPLGAVVLPSDKTTNDSSVVQNNGRYYVCTTTTTGTSGSDLPVWPKTETEVLTGTVTEGGVTWQEKGRVWEAGKAYTTVDIVVPVHNNGHFYRCTGAGTSVAEPAWLRGPGSTVTETGGPTWTEIGTIFDRTDTTDRLLYYLEPTQQDRYGTGYSVVTAGTKFVKFSSTTEVDATGTDEKNILRVTIKNNDSAEILSQLFTIQ